jgi:hypothetical protein
MGVLFEGEQKGGKCSGLTSNYLRVASEYPAAIENTLINVRIDGVDGDHCTGAITGSFIQKGESLSELTTMQYLNRPDACIGV